MSKKDFDDFKQRDTLSLFGDESRSNCTVAEAKAFEKNHRRSRSSRALVIGLPILVLLIAGLATYIYLDHRHYVEAVAAEKAENENPKRNEIREGKPDAKFVIQVEGLGNDSLPAAASFVLSQTVGTKPSEVYIEKTFSGEMSPKPLKFAMKINGQTEFQVLDDETGEMTTVDVSNPLTKAELLVKVANQEWNRLYPDAQYPLAIAIPKKEEASDVEKAQMEKERQKQEKFSNIPLATDPRMSSPIQE